MGLFSSKKKVVVNTTVVPVFQEGDIPNASLTATIRSTLYELDLHDNLKEELIGSIGVRVNNMHTWAKTNYLYGTPKAKFITALDAQTKVEEELTDQYGVGTTFTYYRFGPLNSVHWAWQQLVDSHGYNPATNVLGNLTTSKGFTVYLTDLVPTYTQATYDNLVEAGELGTLDVLGPLANSGISVDYPAGNPEATVTPYIVSPTDTFNSVRVHYQYKNAVNVTVNESLVLTLSSVAEDNDFHHCRCVTAGGLIKFFTYEDGQGTYPLIDAVFDLQSTAGQIGTYLPWTYFRYDFQNIGREDNRTSEEYRDSVKLARYVGVNYQDMSDAIHEDQDVSDVIQNIMLFGVNGIAPNMVEKEYLFRHFDGLFLAKTNGDPEGLVGAETGSNSLSQVIQDDHFTMTFSMSGIRREIVTGVTAPVGKYSSLVSGGNGVYCHQVDTNSFVRVTVYSPTLRNHILGKYGHVAGLTSDLRIPVDRAILRQMSLVKREELLSRALYLNVNTYVEIKSPWYSASWFKIFLIVVVIVITVVSMGGFAAVYAAIAATLAAGVVAVALAILTYVIKALIVQLAVKLFIDVAGLENSIFAAALMIAATAFVAPGSTMAGMPTADVLLQVGNNMMSQVTTGYQDAMLEVQEDLQAFNKYAEGKWDEIEQTNAEMAKETNSINSLEFVTMEPGVVWGESPMNFFDRTVHSGNIGSHTFATVNDYVKNALTLPKFTETIGDTNNVG